MAALRTARVDDAMEIARLAGELGYPLGVAAMEDRLRAILPLPQHHVTVAQDGNGGLLGWIAIERRLTLESGERIEIVGLVVDAAARGTGIGRALVADGERWAHAQGFESIGVRSNVARERSHPFYENLGYARVKTQHVYRKVLK
ncbi:GNAT family N-acetyltransferase [Rhodanobacter sp. 7MK24]|uniref:GNAT family N-acetyltransferase n=1 Tax=Rhodanobacter sp. 7MK24 TaxID=2775922 RepID=UPI0017872F3D|nr:GNAT family N-acetyltransferase [Rhodanobacter sp. 7MK24]MBD8880729.1 GNAT family N-acetyltransferase [Rhodanobacter sp. 7MK24]